MKNTEPIKLITFVTTQGAIQDAMKHSVHRNKKKYYRKLKHKTKQHG